MMMIKKNRAKRFIHSLGGVESTESGDTMTITAKSGSKKTQESLRDRLERFTRKVGGGDDGRKKARTI
jgi:hypothetical protein